MTKIDGRVAWKLKKIALGLCSQCGEVKLFTKRLCLGCYEKLTKYNKKYRATHRKYFRAKCAEWRREHPNYMKDYYRTKVKSK